MTRFIENIRRTIKTRTAKIALACAAAIGTAGMIPSSAMAGERDYHYDHDHDHNSFRFDLGVANAPVYQTRTERVWVEPVYRTVCDRVWVAPVTQDVCNRVWVEPVYQVRDVVHGYGWRQYVTHERVCVTPGHYEDRHTQVVVTPGHWDNVDRQELVTAGYWVDRPVAVHVAERPAFDFAFGFHGH
jgi:hypothetical protein